MRIMSLCALCAVWLCLTADPAGAATRGRLGLSGGMWLEFEDLRIADVHNR